MLILYTSIIFLLRWCRDLVRTTPWCLSDRVDTKLSYIEGTFQFLKVFQHVTSIRIVPFFTFLTDLRFIMDEMTF